MPRILGLGAIILIVHGCELADPAPDAASLITDRTVYVARYISGEAPYQRYGFRVVARFENRTGQTLHLLRCHPDSPRPIYQVELLDDSDGGASAYNGMWACAGHGHPIVVRSGEVRVDTLDLQGPNLFDGRSGELYGTLAGRMQIAYLVGCAPVGECEVDSAVGRSNDFTVQVELQS
jgi:hypothetical protein